jgi:hypothetical protein
LSGALAAATVLSTIPAVNVIAAEPVAPEVDVVSQYELDLFKYGPELLADLVPGFEDMNPAQFEAVKDMYLDGNYVSWETSKQTNYNADGTQTGVTMYEYDPATGKRIKYSYSSGSYSYYNTYEYDSNGNETKSSSYNSEGELTGYTTYEYDANGNTSRYNNYRPDGTLTSYSIYERTYHDNGKRASYAYKHYSEVDGQFIWTSGWIDRYDENGNYTQDINYSYDYNKKELYESSRYDYIYEQNEYGYLSRSRVNHYTKGEFDYYYTSNSTFSSGADSYDSYTYYFKPDGSKYYTYKYVYTKVQTSESSYSYYNTEYQYWDKDDNVVDRTVYERDDSGKTICETHYSNGNFSSKYTYEYGEFGDNKTKLQTKYTYYNSNNEVSSYTVYEYYRNEFFDNGHHVPDFDAYVAPEGCVFQYRLYNPNSGEHFYSGSREESLNLVQAGWNFEGAGFISPTAGDAVYRLYNAEHGDHIYTKNVDEVNALIQNGWTFDGGDWAAAFPSDSPENGRPVYRLHNPNAWESGKSGAWHFTMDETERDNLKAIGWEFEGVGWYSR